jgi:T-complex protein 1 subunit gamma
LAQNCGANVVRSLTELRAKHSEPDGSGLNWGINGNTGKIEDMTEANVWDPVAVK